MTISVYYKNATIVCLRKVTVASCNDTHPGVEEDFMNGCFGIKRNNFRSASGSYNKTNNQSAELYILDKDCKPVKRGTTIPRNPAHVWTCCISQDVGDALEFFFLISERIDLGNFSVKLSEKKLCWILVKIWETSLLMIVPRMSIFLKLQKRTKSDSPIFL